MKAMGGLFDLIARHDNLAAAAWRAAQGKRQRPEVARWLLRANMHLADMASELRAGEFEFSPYRSFAIRDPKSRTIHAPAFRDRVMHHALIAITGPVLERGAIHQSYACRAGKGQHAALDWVRARLRPDGWFLKIDVEKYYDTIPHGLLERRLSRRFREARLMSLWRGLLDSYSTAEGLGLPIGALTSQYLGNFHLDPIDHFIQQSFPKVHHCRYMDDFLLLGPKEDLLDARRRIADRMAEAGLRIKNGGVLDRVADGVPYFGFTLYPGRIRLNAPGRKRLRRACGEMTRRLRREDRETTQAECDSLTSQFVHASKADDVGWRRTLCEGLNEIWERQGLATGHPGRLMEQHGQELPLRDPQQEEPREPQQEPGLPPLLVLRHGGVCPDRTVPPPDDAFSSAPSTDDGDEPTVRFPLPAKISPRIGRKTDEGEGPGELF